MADYDIDIYGGMITVTADTTPAGHNITTNSIPEWCYEDTAGSVWTCKVSSNYEADNRTGEISVQITTNESGDYDPTSISEERTFSFTQKGTGTTPVETYELVITLKSEIASITAEEVEFALFTYGEQGYTRVSDIKSYAYDELPTISETIIDLTGLTTGTTYQMRLHPVCSETGWCGSAGDIVYCDYTYPVGGSGNSLGTGSIITDGSGDGWTSCGNQFTLSDAHSSNGVIVIELKVE